jgi:hypothetical protein
VTDDDLDPRLGAGVDLLRRSGAKDFRVGCTPDDDGDPIVWYAVVTYEAGGEAAAALDPTTAVMRLCDQVITGGTCTHCGRDTIFDENPSDTVFDHILGTMGCRYAWDPGLGTFRRDCEGKNR